MLKISNKTPHGRLLGLFDILEDWVDAQNYNAQLPDAFNNHFESGILRQFLTKEAEKVGAAMPEILANQLFFLASAALYDQLNNQNSTTLNHAKSAASALISAQTKTEFRIEKSYACVMTTIFLGVLVVGSLFMFNFNAFKLAENQQIATVQNNVFLQTVDTPDYANPEDTAALIAQINQMRSGNCQLIEALQLPDSYKKVYFENIVLGQISSNVSDQKLVHQLLDKVRCNYTPMLMAKSK